MKKVLSLVLCLAMALGCCSWAAAEEKIELEVVCNVSNVGSFDSVIEQLIEEFTAETGIAVSYNPVGQGYEELMKTRMASNDMPDVFTTHGWAVVRYGEYLEPLNNEAYFANIADGIRPIVTDNDGNLVVLPAAYSVFGINYNADVLAAAGVKPEEIKTWEDFEAACDAIKASGVAPISVGGKEAWTAAQFYQDVCASLLNEEDAAALADGSFDWEKIRPIAERYVKWVQNGYFNVDAVTADYATTSKQLAVGDAAFIMNGTDAISTALEFKADANLHVIPVPAADESQEQFAIGGEYLSWGVWKDSEHKEAALKFIEFLARKENITKQANAVLMVPGIAGAEFDAGPLTDDFKLLSGYKVKGVWDRSLPSGMFNDMCSSGQAILSQEANAVDATIEQFKMSYADKMGL